MTARARIGAPPGYLGRFVAGGRRAPAVGRLRTAPAVARRPPAPCALIAAIALAILTAAPDIANAQGPRRHGLWVAFGMGGGRVERWSDQEPTTKTTTVTMSVRGGVTVVPALRVGLEINGWGIETSDVADPSKGVTVNETMVIAQVYPWPTAGVYLKGGIGRGGFDTGHVGDIDSRAFGATVLGIGYDVRVARNVFITLAADWARGPLGDANPLVVTSTGRRFRAWSATLGIQYH